MLDTFRKASRAWYIKLLFCLLILSFLGWGVGDMLRSGITNRPAIEVGHRSISGQEVADAFRREFDRMQSMFGGKLTPEQARQLGLLQRTTRDMISRELLTQAGDSLKLTVDQDSLRKTIAGIPAFQNELKQFDKGTYLRMLGRNGLTEKQFLADLQGDSVRDQVAQAVGGGVQAPQAEAVALFRYRQEKRVAETIAVPFAKMPAPANPGEPALRDYLKAHTADFMAPELRGITALVVRTVDVSGDIKPSDADIEKSYQIRQGEFGAPEKRKLEQVLFTDQTQAQAFADAVRGGKDFAATAKAGGKDVTDLGWQDRKGLPLPQLADAAFALPAAGVAGPVKTALGWHVIRVAAVAAGQTRPLSDVRSIIVQDLVKEEATNRLYQLSTKLEDSIGSGAGIEEAAGSLNLKPIKVAAMDPQGNGPDGKPQPNLPVLPAVLAAAFQTGQGSTTEVQALDNNEGYFVLRVDSVTPPAAKPFEAVKDQVLAAWSAEQKRQAARKQADALAERLRKGDAVATVATGFKLDTTQPFTRAPAENSPVSPALAAEMFKADPGAVAVVDDDTGSTVARLKQVVPADPAAQAAAVDRLRAQLSQALANDLLTQYLAALEKDYGVTVNTAVIDRQFEK